MKSLILAVLFATSNGEAFPNMTIMFSERYECPNTEVIEKRVYHTESGPLLTVHWVGGDGSFISVQFSSEGSPERVILSRPDLPAQHMTFEELTSRYANPCLTLPGAPGERA